MGLQGFIRRVCPPDVPRDEKSPVSRAKREPPAQATHTLSLSSATPDATFSAVPGNRRCGEKSRVVPAALHVRHARPAALVVVYLCVPRLSLAPRRREQMSARIHRVCRSRTGACFSQRSYIYKGWASRVKSDKNGRFCEIIRRWIPAVYVRTMCGTHRDDLIIEAHQSQRILHNSPSDFIFFFLRKFNTLMTGSSRCTCSAPTTSARTLRRK